MAPTEIESKFYINDLNKIKSRLRRLKARLIQRRTHETNIRFDTTGGHLQSQKQVLRLRQDSKTRMAFKGPGNKQSGVVSRVEIEFTVEDFDLARQFIEALGYKKIFFYEKYRAIYKLGKTHIMLDEMPYGSFLEIEGSDSDSVVETANRLGLNMDAAISYSYHGLFKSLREKEGFDFSDLSFENFAAKKITPKELGVIPADVVTGK